MSLEYSVVCCSSNNVIKFCVSHAVLPKLKNNLFVEEVFDRVLTRDCAISDISEFVVCKVFSWD